jgi:CMP-N-acetylneuraminic acid synthetase
MKKTIEQFVINDDATLRDALIQMTSTHRGIILVVDSDYTLEGVISDGDVRRALLDDISLKIPVTQIMNLNPKIAGSESEAREMLDDNTFLILIPVVNKDGMLTGVLSALNGRKYYRKDTGENTEDDAEQTHEKHTRFLAIIPARGGSKRIPEKNLSKIGNDTLLSLAIKAGKKSSFIDNILVSTDSKKIAAEAEKNGVLVPELRPARLSDDSAKTIDVLHHEVSRYTEKKQQRPEFVVLLEPTAPLRSSTLIDEAIEHFLSFDNADSLVSVNLVRHIYHPEELLKSTYTHFLEPYLEGRTFDNRKLRTEQDQLYIQNGLIYITKTSVLLDQHSIYGSKVLKFETPESLFADIDEKEDLELARVKYKKLSPLQ